MAELRIDVCPNGDGVTLVLDGEIDMASVDSLRACLDELDPRWRTVALDMAGVSFLDSSGVAALVHAHQRLPPGGSLEVQRPSDPVRKILEITRLDELLGLSEPP